jgi:hypothetical protein
MSGRSEYAQTRFAGELSPRLHGRWETELYRAGLAFCENWEVLAQGSLRRRGGTSKKAALASGTRLIPLRSGSGNDFNLVIGDRTIRIVNVSGGDETVGASTLDVELVPAGGFPPWVVVSGTPTYAAGVFTLDSGEAMRLAITVTAAGNHTFKMDCKSFVGDTLSRSIGVKIGAAPGGSEIRNYFAWFGGDWSTQGDVTVTFPAPGTYYIQLTAGANGAAQVSVRDVSMRYVSSGGAVTGPWSLLQAPSVQFVAETGVDRTILVHPNVQPQALTRAANGTWALDPVVFTNGPAEWAGTNWPGAVDIYQSRLWLGGAPGQPNAFSASRVGELFDFRRFTDTTNGASTPHAGPATSAIKITPECAFTQKVATKGAIRWIQGRQTMLVGTDLGVHSITAQSGAIGPTDMHVRQESGFASAAVQTADIGDLVLYVSSDRRKVRALALANEQAGDAWVAKDLTFVAEHLTRSLVKEVHYARDPSSTIVLVLDSGELACCTFDRAEQLMAWWRWKTAGTVRSATVCDGEEGSLLFLAVERTNGTYLEVMPLSELAAGRVYCDSALTVPLAIGATVAPGFGHLEGQFVNVIVDGAELEADQAVVGGTVTLAEARDRAVTVTAGLPYTSTARTLRPVTGKGVQRAVRRWVRLFLRLYDSAFPKVYGERVRPDRSPSTAYDTAEPRYTGDAGPVETDAETLGQVEIVQDLPLRTEVLALHGVIAESEV